MENALKNLFAVTDLRNRVLFTLALLGVYRVGSHIPTPGINQEALDVMAQQAAGTMFGLYDMFSGQNLSNMTIFALGVMPYISASIILQLLTVVWPYLERISKEGELGRRKITQYTRYLTLALAVVQAMGIAIWLERSTDAAGGLPLVYAGGWGFRLMTVITLTTGTMFIMWLGEQITERGIGNGMSLIIFAGIVVNLPSAILLTFDQMSTGQIGPIRVLFLLAMSVAVVGAIVFVERGLRRIIVQYAKRVVGRRQYGGFLPGIRPGKRTAEYIDTILSRITLVGAVYLALIALLPNFLISGFRVAPIPFVGERLDAILPQWFTQGLNVPFLFGGTSLLIVVGVAMDTVQQIESQLIMRHYDGFMKKTRIRGRRGQRNSAPAMTPAQETMGLNVIMMGPPGAGKGTQAGRFARERGVLKISTGDILRDAIRERDPIALEAKAR